MATTESVLLQRQRKLSVERSLKSKIQPQVKPKLRKFVKTQEGSSSDCSFQDFENLESLNRHRSSFAKRQPQDYWCNLLITFHTSKQDLSTVKNILMEHLQWFKQVIKC